MIHIHVLETRMQAVSGPRMYGRTLPEHMDAIGFLSPRVCFEHGIWLTPSDIELVRDRGVTVVHNPVSNMKLGSGIAPVPELLGHGVNVALGTDGMCSNDGNDMFATLKTAALLHKLWEVDYEQWLGAEEAWEIATGRRGRRGRPRRPRLARAGPPRRPRAARPRVDRLHAAQRPAAAGRARLDHARGLVGDGRRRVARPRRPGDRRRRGAVLAEGRARGAEIVARHDEGFEIGQELLARSAPAGSRRCGRTSASNVSSAVKAQPDSLRE